MKNKGFTLIELLVVVAIIGVLASIIIPSLSDAQARSRDARRLSDIRTIQTALEIYNLDNGSYPVTTAAWNGSNTTDWTALETAMGTTLPVDPLNTSVGTESEIEAEGNYVYTYFAFDTPLYCNANAYFIGFQLEGKNGNGANDGVAMCDGAAGPLFRSGGITFVVGTDRDGNFITPDLSGTAK